MKCPVCYSLETQSLGELHAYSDYVSSVRQCSSCGCRYALRESGIHEVLHQDADSTYGTHYTRAKKVKAKLDGADVAAARRLLVKESKFRFILDSIDQIEGKQHILEMGCSSGSLTAYLNALGHTAIGADVSMQSVDAATNLFGESYVIADMDTIAARGPYGVICHAGTIGCVDEPVTFTSQLLTLLEPNGKLVFNAPNLDFAIAGNQKWIATTPPPDLVTLFPADFWKSQFEDDEFDVSVTVENISAAHFHKLTKTPGTWVRGRAALFEAPSRQRLAITRAGYYLSTLYQIIANPMRQTNLVYPAEYGVHVCITRKQG